MDEAMHPLTLMVVGLYGQVLPNQDGAPLRLIVPWKYGFKSIKSIVKISFLERAAAHHLEHRGAERIRVLRQREPACGPPALEPGDGAADRRAVPVRAPTTLMFNGYEEQVASLYKGMDLRRYF